MRGFLGRTIASHFRCHPRDIRFHPFSDHSEPVDEWSMYFCTVPFPYPHSARASPPLGLSFFGCVAAMETTTVCAGSKVLSTRRGGRCVCIGVERKSQTATPPPGTAWLHSTHVQPLPAKLGAFLPCARLCVCATAQSKARTPKDSQRRIPGMMMLGTLCSRRSDDDQQRAYRCVYVCF